jgi:hypothetical protein
MATQANESESKTSHAYIARDGQHRPLVQNPNISHTRHWGVSIHIPMYISNNRPVMLYKHINVAELIKP